MQSEKKQLQRQNFSTRQIIYLLLTIAGLSFCFFLGFPFDNHNESYLWVTIFNKVSFGDTLTKQVIGIESFRPLGMANAWLTYRLSGNIYLQQILNWMFAVASFIVLFFAARNKILYAVLSFVTGACFFSGYIYLFHLHGVFYGPFQLYVAVLTCIAFQQRRLSSKILVITAIATFIICLYHTFTLLVYCGFLCGYILQLKTTGKKIEYIRLAIVLVLTLLLAKIILQNKELKTIAVLADGFLTTYSMTEVNKALAVIASLLSVLASISFAKSSSGSIIFCVVTLLLAALCMYLRVPVLILWVTICLIKMIMQGNWVMAGLIAATAILPLGSGSGSPTYIVFLVMICTFVTAENESLFIHDYPVFRRLALVGLLLLFACLAALKKNVQVPLASAMARPILAEQEKTKQLKKIIEWKLKSKEYAALGLVLYDAKKLPVSLNNSINRINRPVTGQDDINAYFDFFSKDSIPNSTKLQAAFVTFGDKILPGRTLIFSADGTWNGKAYVFR